MNQLGLEDARPISLRRAEHNFLDAPSNFAGVRPNSTWHT